MEGQGAPEASGLALVRLWHKAASPQGPGLIHCTVLHMLPPCQGGDSQHLLYVQSSPYAALATLHCAH